MDKSGRRLLGVVEILGLFNALRKASSENPEADLAETGGQVGGWVGDWGGSVRERVVG